jgi:hypothetical protein
MDDVVPNLQSETADQAEGVFSPSPTSWINIAMPKAELIRKKAWWV